MRKKTLLIAFALGTILFSCGTKNGKETNGKEMASLKDSVKEANDFRLLEIRQDSIDGLQIKNFAVKKLSGTHKYGGLTTIKYSSLSQLIAQAKKESEKEMWTNEELLAKINTYKISCLGGELRLDIERSTIESANMKFFSIIIKDTTEKEIYRVQLDSDIPEVPISNDNWWNIHTEWIPNRIQAPFYVYVVDRLEEVPFKFEIKAIKK